MKAADIVEILETFVQNTTDLAGLKKSLAEPQNETQAQEFIVAVHKILKINIKKSLNDWELLTPLFAGEIFTGVLQWLNYLFLVPCYDNAKEYLQLLALSAGVIGSISGVYLQTRWRKSASLKIVAVSDQLLKFYSSEEMQIWKHKKIKTQLIFFLKNSGIAADNITKLGRYAAESRETPAFIKIVRQLENEFIQNLKNSGKQSLYVLSATVLAFLYFKLNLLYKCIYNPGGGVVDFFAVMIVIFSAFNLKKNYEGKHYGPLSIEWHRKILHCYLENLQFNFTSNPLPVSISTPVKKKIPAAHEKMMRNRKRPQEKTCREKLMKGAAIAYQWSCSFSGFCLQIFLNYFKEKTAVRYTNENDWDFGENSSAKNSKKTVLVKKANAAKNNSASAKKARAKQSFMPAGPIAAILRNPDPMIEPETVESSPQGEAMVDLGKISIHSSTQPIWKKLLPFAMAEQVDILWGTCKVLLATNKRKSIELEQKNWELTQTKKALQAAQAKLAEHTQEKSANISSPGLSLCV